MCYQHISFSSFDGCIPKVLIHANYLHIPVEWSLVHPALSYLTPETSVHQVLPLLISFLTSDVSAVQHQPLHAQSSFGCTTDTAFFSSITAVKDSLALLLPISVLPLSNCGLL